MGLQVAWKEKIPFRGVKGVEQVGFNVVVAEMKENGWKSLNTCSVKVWSENVLSEMAPAGSAPQENVQRFNIFAS